MKLVRQRAIFLIMAFTTMVMLGYTNCAGPKEGVVSDSSGGTVTFGQCTDALIEVYRNSYRPLVADAALCARCHSDSGTSPVKFASSNMGTAISELLRVGVDQVDANAVSPSHASGVTGTHLTARVNAARAAWAPGYAEYVDCQSRAGGITESSFITVDKIASSIYFEDNRTATLSWDLTSTEIQPAGARFQGILSIDVRVDYETVGGVNVATGYTFTNPRVQMLTGEIEAELEGVILRLNGTEVTGAEVAPFLSARAVARGIDATRIYNGSVSIPRPSVSTSDRISLGIGYLAVRARTDNPPVPPTPTINVTNAFVRTANVPLTISNDTTARRWCLTASSVRPNSTAEICPGFTPPAPAGVTASGWLMSRPTAFDLARIGRAPVSGETITFYLWVANSDLKINANAATGQVTFDTTNPPAPNFSSLSIAGGTQIADIVGLVDVEATEPVRWCVKEGALATDVQNNNGCNFGTTRPEFVGLRGNGTRYVAIHVQDRAGNTASSAVRNIVNSYGPITFEKLTTPSYGAQALFATHCQSCHGEGMPQQTLLDLSATNAGFSSAYAKRTTIRTRINSSTSPMPASGLLPVRSRALIDLWISSGAVQR